MSTLHRRKSRAARRRRQRTSRSLRWLKWYPECDWDEIGEVKS